jgi:hypothetical protein
MSFVSAAVLLHRFTGKFALISIWFGREEGIRRELRNYQETQHGGHMGVKSEPPNSKQVLLKSCVYIICAQSHCTLECLANAHPNSSNTNREHFEKHWFLGNKGLQYS